MTMAERAKRSSRHRWTPCALGAVCALALVVLAAPDRAPAQEATARQKATAQPQADTQPGAVAQQVAQALSGYERGPDESWWRARGPETALALETVFRDRSRPAVVRVRALRAAVHFPTGRTRDFLLAVAREPGQRPPFVREALLSLGRAFGDRVTDAIAAFLDHERPVVRRAACEALSAIGTGAGREQLVRRLRSEPDRSVRSAIERALDR